MGVLRRVQRRGHERRQRDKAPGASKGEPLEFGNLLKEEGWRWRGQVEK